jgi:hypothetical protein
MGPESICGCPAAFDQVAIPVSIPLSMLGTDSTVADDCEYARVKTSDSFASLSRYGMVGLPYPSALTWSARTVSIRIHTTL